MISCSSTPGGKVAMLYFFLQKLTKCLAAHGRLASFVWHKSLWTAAHFIRSDAAEAGCGSRTLIKPYHKIVVSVF